MTFFSRLNRPKAKPAPRGNGTAPVYREVLDDGQPHLVVDSVDNLFEYVQASKEECNVYNLIERYRRGDKTALGQPGGQYVDVTGMPTSLMEAFNVMQKTRRSFDALPADVRAKFDDNFDVYLQTMATANVDQLQSLFGAPAAASDTPAKEGEE